MSWASAADLIVGDMNLTGVDTAIYLSTAERDMNSVLGEIYVLPIPGTLDQRHLDSLKNIHAKIATGLLIMAQAVSQESEVVHAYGASLLEEGKDKLHDLANLVELSGTPGAVRIIATSEDRRARAIGGDTTSPFDVFRQQVYGQVPQTLTWPN